MASHTQSYPYIFFFFSSRRRHTRCALVTGVQTCALPICPSAAGRSCQGGPGDIPRGASPAAQDQISIAGRTRPDRLSDRRVGRPAQSSLRGIDDRPRSEEHTSELQSLMRISYAVFCLKKKKTTSTKIQITDTTTNI